MAPAMRRVLNPMFDHYEKQMISSEKRIINAIASVSRPSPSLLPPLSGPTSVIPAPGTLFWPSQYTPAEANIAGQNVGGKEYYLDWHGQCRLGSKQRVVTSISWVVGGPPQANNLNPRSNPASGEPGVTPQASGPAANVPNRKRDRRVLNLNGEELVYETADLPPAPAIHFSDRIDSLFEEWESSTLLTVKEQGIPIKHWSDLYKFGTKSTVFSS